MGLEAERERESSRGSTRDVPGIWGWGCGNAETGRLKGRPGALLCSGPGLGAVWEAHFGKRERTSPLLSDIFFFFKECLCYHTRPEVLSLSGVCILSPSVPPGWAGGRPGVSAYMHRCAQVGAGVGMGPVAGGAGVVGSEPGHEAAGPRHTAFSDKSPMSDFSSSQALLHFVWPDYDFSLPVTLPTV